jgi:hypothetical protein
MGQGFVECAVGDSGKRESTLLKGVANQRIFELLSPPGAHKAECINLKHFADAWCEAALNVKERGVDIEGDKVIAFVLGHMAMILRDSHLALGTHRDFLLTLQIDQLTTPGLRRNICY